MEKVAEGNNYVRRKKGRRSKKARKAETLRVCRWCGLVSLAPANKKTPLEVKT